MPMDPFEEKHKMMGQLLDMLKRHASEEVDSGLHKPEGEDKMAGLEIEKVEVLPEHEMDKPTPVHEVDTKMIPEEKSSVLDALNVRDPMKKDASAEPADVSDEDAGEEPSFPMMFGKKRKK